jgi:YesN/AraC family two-component response regulator
MVSAGMSLVVYRGYRQSLFQTSRNYNEIILSQVRGSMDTIIKSIDNLSINIATNGQISKIGTSDNLTARLNIPASMDIISILSAHTSNNSYIDSMLVYYRRSGMVITNNSRFLSIREFIDFSSNAYWSQSEFESLIALSATVRYAGARTLDSSGGKNILTLVYPLVIQSPGQQYGCVIVNLNQNFFTGFTDSVSAGGKTLLVAVDGTGAELFRWGNEKYSRELPELYLLKPNETIRYSHTTGHSYVASSVASQVSPWRYFLITEESNFIITLGGMMTVYLAAALFIAGIFLSIFLAWRNFHPVQQTLQTVSRFFAQPMQEKHLGELETIRYATEQALTEYNSLTSRMSKQIPVIQANITRGLLLNSVQTDELDAEAMAMAGIHFKHRYFSVLLLHLEDLEQKPAGATLVTAQLKELAEKELQQANTPSVQIWLAEVEVSTIGAILNTDSDFEKNRDWLRQSCRRVLDAMQQQTGMVVDIAIGPGTETADTLHEAYLSAYSALQYHLLNRSGGIIEFDSYSPDQTQYYYPIDVEQNLIQYVRTGHLADVHQLLNTLIMRNFVDSKLSKESAKCLLFSLIGTAMRVQNTLPLRVLSSKSVDELYRHISAGHLSIQAVEATIRGMFSEICLNVNAMKQKNKQSINAIRNYIDAHYQDQGLSLQSVAGEAGLNANYFSQYFKDNVGVNFATYVNRVRLEKASEYLKNESWSIDEISQMTGYTNTAVFIRNFKKQFNQTPGKYRQQQQAGR